MAWNMELWVSDEWQSEPGSGIPACANWSDNCVFLGLFKQCAEGPLRPQELSLNTVSTPLC
jgi:hypothetical protein